MPNKRGPKRIPVDPGVIERFDAAADGKPWTRFMDRNRLILVLWSQADPMEKVLLASRTTRPEVWKVLRLARLGLFDRLVEKRKAGRRGHRAKIIDALKRGESTGAVAQTFGVHLSTIWRSKRALTKKQAPSPAA